MQSEKLAKWLDKKTSLNPPFSKNMPVMDFDKGLSILNFSWS